MSAVVKLWVLWLWVIAPLSLLSQPMDFPPKGHQKEFRQHQRRAHRKPRQTSLPKSNPKWRQKKH